MQVTHLNQCDAAQQLLCQAVSEWGMDIAIIADPYRVPVGNGNWIADGSRKIAALWTMGKYPVQELVSPTYDGLRVAKVNRIFLWVKAGGNSG